MSNILIIDNDFENTMNLKMILSSDSHNVQVANNGRKGLQLLKESGFDVVIIEIIMPDLDGFEVIMQINGMQVQPRVIATIRSSANLDRGYLMRVAKVLKAHHVLYKPFSADEIKNSLLECKFA